MTLRLPLLSPKSINKTKKWSRILGKKILFFQASFKCLELKEYSSNSHKIADNFSLSVPTGW